MLENKRKSTRCKSEWKTWTLVAEEGKKLNRQVSRESDRLIKKTDKLLTAITKTKVA